ncbi:hypothetical protein JTE90_005087 [Oedothorax gibbosus]|uniref:Lipocalin/cytosolic fatty-acid binding domain-containing protein n=1 Tax=Oedothorax gibbosus TaxID=931172 RepID=A0AAV6V9L7_9ARAC|nr:hypothetical protein JTE90_005087 [Oedothorax gibbosus]
MSLVIVLACVLAAVGGCHGNTFRMGACPRVTVMEQVDFDKFSGEWYVIQRYNPMATCTKMVIEKGTDGTYAVNETSRPLGLNFGFHNQYMKARKVEFLKNDTKSIFRLERNFAHFTLSTFGVVNTDYDNYALVWGCDPVLFGSVQNVDILARKSNPEPEVLKTAKDILKDMQVDYHQIDNVDQSHCGDSSNSEGSSVSVDRNTNNIVLG